MYSILIEHRAERDLDKLEPRVRDRIIAHLLELRDNPRTQAKKLKGSKNAWRVRIGDFRIIYEIMDAAKEVGVYRIKHRSRVY